MVGKKLYLDFLGNLVFHASLPDLFLVDHFDGQGEPGTQIASHVDVPETAFAQFAADLEVRKSEFVVLAGEEHVTEIEERLVGVLTVAAAVVGLGAEGFLVGHVETGFETFFLVLQVLLLFGLVVVEFVGLDHGGGVGGA